MFKFFPDDDDVKQPQSDPQPPPAPSSPQKPTKETVTSDSHLKLSRTLKTTQVKVGSTQLCCVNLTELSQVVEDTAVKGILESSSDLESGVYEGGFKTWECTWDLGLFVHDNIAGILGNKRRVRVLDLGCGSGLLGLSLLKLGTEMGIEVAVDFHDYNEQVLDTVTVPNALLNFPDELVAACRFFSGDWATFQAEEQYDLILSSETIYNLDYFDRFVGVVARSLKDRCCLYLAAKTFYFGVGGGTRAFLKTVNSSESLSADVVLAIKQGVQREIVRVTRL